MVDESEFFLVWDDFHDCFNKLSKVIFFIGGNWNNKPFINVKMLYGPFYFIFYNWSLFRPRTSSLIIPVFQWINFVNLIYYYYKWDFR